jgi:DNA-directed RNA polymerase specialized sigma24 family protein
VPHKGVIRGEAGPEPTDRALATGIMEGDEAAFRALYRRHTPRLWPLLMRMLGGQDSRPDAEDTVQETWIRAVEALPSFRWEAAFSTWLTGIALNCARQTLRKRARRSEVGPGGLERVGRPPPDPGRRMDLEAAIAALPDGYRTVLVLHDLEGFTHPEISERLEISVGTSRSQLHHARRAMRKLLEPIDEVVSDATRRD